MMILQSDMAYELGGHNLPAVGNTLVTTEEDFVPEDEIILIGKDLPQHQPEGYAYPAFQEKSGYHG